MKVPPVQTTLWELFESRTSFGASAPSFQVPVETRTGDPEGLFEGTEWLVEGDIEGLLAAGFCAVQAAATIRGSDTTAAIQRMI
jgi:hypothetical protein